jgi:large subunit ribosomal protein L29
MKIEEVRGLSTKELKERVDAKTVSLDQIKINHSVSPLDNPAQIKQLRREIARLKTELHQREEQINN